MSKPLWQAGREIACDPDLTTDLTAWVEKTCALQEVDSMVMARLQLVVEELYTNLLDHAVLTGDSQVQVELSGMQDGIALDWRDSGTAFNPFDTENDASLQGDVADRPVGGLGLHLVRSLGQDLIYRYENGHNHLTMSLPF